ncbi:MAG: hypothetical protein ACRDT0_02705 [Pseudonocardiaceae bacterium]
MTDYSTIAELSTVYLEDSYVLDIVDDPPLLELKIEAVLTEEHPRYRPPGPAEQYCYAAGRLVFRDVSRVEWERQSLRTYTDVTGEEDRGNIDFLEIDGDHWYAGGDWGEVRIFTTARPEFTLIGENASRRGADRVRARSRPAAGDRAYRACEVWVDAAERSASATSRSTIRWSAAAMSSAVGGQLPGLMRSFRQWSASTTRTRRARISDQSVPPG